METFHPDILFSPFKLVGEAEAFGGKIRYFDNQPPNLIKPAIDSIEQLPSLKVQDVDSHPSLLFFRQTLSKMVKGVGTHAAIGGIMLSPIDMPLMIMGIDGWLNTVLFDDDGVKRMLDVTVPFFVKRANTLLAEGADCLVMPATFFSPKVITRQIAENFTLPVLRQAFAEVKGPIVLHHGGSPVTPFLDICAGLPNVMGFVVDHSDDLSDARGKIGDDPTLMGGPDGPNLWKLSPEEIETQCKEILLDRQNDSKFVLASTGPDVAFDTPPENILAMKKSVESFGS
jgi:uroporphyrinogen decarboxylase